MTQVQTRVDRVGSQCSTNCATMLCYRCKLEILFLYLMRLSSSSWLEEQMFLTILLLYYSNKNRYYYIESQYKIVPMSSDSWPPNKPSSSSTNWGSSMVRFKLLAITLRVIAITITIMAKKLIDYYNIGIPRLMHFLWQTENPVRWNLRYENHSIEKNC